MKVPFVSFLPMEKELNDDLRAAFERVFESSWYIIGKEDTAFEKAFAKYGTVCDSYAHGLYAENVKNLDLIRFTAESAGESIDSIKII